MAAAMPPESATASAMREIRNLEAIKAYSSSRLFRPRVRAGLLKQTAPVLTGKHAFGNLVDGVDTGR
jgi:hypothetical protein